MAFTGFSDKDIIIRVGALGVEEARAQIESTGRSVEKLSDAVNRFAKYAAAAFAAQITAATVAAAKFEHQMSLVWTQTDLSREGFEALKRATLDFAQKTGRPIGEVTRAMYDYNSAGGETARTLQDVGLAAKAASAGNTSLDIALRAGMATINAFGLPLSELNRIYDIQFQTVRYGVMTYEEFATAIGTALGPARALGASLEEVHAAFAGVTRGGYSADEAATAIARLSDSLAEHADKWRAIGINVYDASGKFRGFSPILNELAARLEGLSDAQRKATLQSLDLEIRAARGLMAIVGNQERYNEIVRAVTNSTGAMNDAFRKTEDDASRLAGIVKNQLHVSMISYGNMVLDVIKPALKVLAEHPEIISSLTKAVAAVATPVGAAATAFWGLHGVMKVLGPLAASLGVSLGPIGVALVGLTAAMTALNAVHEARLRKMREEIDSVSTQAENLFALVQQYESARKAGQDTKELQEKLAQAFGVTADEIAKNTDRLREMAIEMTRQKAEELRKQLREVEIQLAGTEAGLRAMNLQSRIFDEVLSTMSFGLVGAAAKKDTLRQKAEALRAELAQVEGVLKAEETALNRASEATQKKAAAAVVAKAETDKYAQAVEVLKEANIRLTGGLTEQQEELLNAARTVKLTTDEWLRLTDRMVEMTPKGAAVASVIAQVAKAAEESGDKAAAAQIVFRALGPTLNAIGAAAASAGGSMRDGAEATEAQAEAASQAKEKNRELASAVVDVTRTLKDMVARVYGADSAFSILTSALVDVVASGFNPVSIALSGFSALISLLDGGHKKHREETERTRQAYERWRQEVAALNEELQENLGALGDAGKLMEQVLRQMAETRARMFSFVPGSHELGAKDFEEAVQAWMAYLGEAFRRAFAIVQPFQVFTAGVDDLIARTQAAIAQFGGALDLEPIREVFLQVIAQAWEWYRTLEAGTPAHQEAAARLLQLQLMSRQLGATWALQGEAWQQFLLQIGPALKEGTEAWRIWARACEEAGIAVTHTTKAASDAIEPIERLAGAGQHAAAAGDEVRRAWGEAGNVITSVSDAAVQRVVARISEVKNATRGLDQALEWLQEWYELFGQVNPVLLQHFNEETEKTLKLWRELPQHSEAWYKVGMAISSSYHDVQKMTGAVQGADENVKKLAVAGDEAGEAVAHLGSAAARTEVQVAELAEVLPIAPLHEAAQAARELGDAIEKIPVSVGVGVAATPAAGAGAAVMAQLERYREAVRVMQSALASLRTWTEAYGEPNAVLVMELQRQMDAVAGLMRTLDPATPLYRELAAALQEAYRQMRILTGDIQVQDLNAEELNAALSGTREEIENVRRKMSDLVLQAGEYMTQLAELERREADATVVWRRQESALAALHTALEFVSEGISEINFYDVYRQLEALTGETYRFTDAWGEFLEPMRQQYRAFEKDIEAMRGALEDLAYFGISAEDFGITDIDEGFLAAYFRIQDFMNTLDPGSKAYQDMLQALSELGAQFEGLGGVLDRSLAADYVMGQTESALELLRQQYEDTIAQIHAQRLEIQTNLDDVTRQLEDLRASLEALLARAAELEMEITVRTGGPPEFHRGGLVEAHAGLYAGDEVPALLQRGEFVLKREAVRALGLGFVSALNAGRVPTANVQVVVHEATPRTWVEVTDANIYPRVKYRQAKTESVAVL